MINIAILEKKFNSLNKFNLVFASFFFSLMTLCVKNIEKRIPIYELVLFRSFLSLIITLFIIKLKKINPWGKKQTITYLKRCFRYFSFSLYFLCDKKYASQYIYSNSVYISNFYIYICWHIYKRKNNSEYNFCLNYWLDWNISNIKSKSIIKHKR